MFAPRYACIFIDAVETEFLSSQYLQPFLWLRYIDDLILIWALGEGKLVQLLNELKAIVNLFSCVKMGSYFYMKIIIMLSHIRKIISFQINSFSSTIILDFLFNFRGRSRLFPFKGVLFTQEIPNEINLLCLDCDVALRLEKTESWKEEVSDFTVKLRGFSFSIQAFKQV